MAFPNLANTAMTATAGVAPFHVVVDLSLTTCAGFTEPFERLVYAVDFGDTMSSVGVTTKSLRWMYSPIAAHVYESPGTYSIKIYVKNKTTGEMSYESATVIVSAFSGTDVHFAVAGDDETGDGSEETPYQSIAKMITEAGPNTRILLARGDTWTAATAAGGINWGSVAGTEAQPFIIDAWGTGADPIIRPHADGAESGLMRMRGITKGKVLNIHFDGRLGVGAGAIYQPGDRNIMHGCEIERPETGIDNASASSQNDWCISNCDLNGADEYLLYVEGVAGNADAAKRIAILGNIFNRTGLTAASPHSPIRGWFQRSVIAFNTFEMWAKDADSAAAGVKIMGATSATEADKARYSVVCDNYFDGADVQGVALYVGPQADTDYTDEEVYNLIVERNEFDMLNDGYAIELHGGGGDIMIRANKAPDCLYFINFRSRDVDSPHTKTYVHCNSARSTATGSPRFIRKYDNAAPFSGVDNLERVGNIWHAPNEAAGDVPNADESTTKFAIAALTESKANCDYNGAAPTNVWMVNEGSLSLATLQAGGREMGSIGSDPMYADPGNGDLTLQAGSPCRANAQLDDAIGVDFRGYERAAPMDIGCYGGTSAFEPQPPPSACTRADALQFEVDSVEIQQLKSTGALKGVVILLAAGANGRGIARLGSFGNGTQLAWRPPGASTFGPLVDCSSDGEYDLEGTTPGKYVRAKVYADFLATSPAQCRVFLEDIYNNAIGHDDVTAEEASAGDVAAYTITMRNASTKALWAPRFWLDAATAGMEISDDGAAWVSPTTRATALVFPDLAPSGTDVLHFRRTISGSASSDPRVENDFHYNFASF